MSTRTRSDHAPPPSRGPRPRATSSASGTSRGAAPRARRAGIVAAAIAIAVASVATPARADDELASYRERFKAGLEKYKGGAVAEALQYWEPIYRELGASKGYRLAFNLARAYETYGDFTRAAERYESFVAEVDARNTAGEKLDAIVAKEEKEARDRLAELMATKGRIKVNAGASAVAVRIDAAEPRVSGFVAYVAPGAHEVVLAPGTSAEDKRQVTVQAGEIAEIAPRPAEDAAPPAPPPRDPVTPLPAPIIRTERRTERPFSPIVVVVGAGVAAASVVLPVLAYDSALSYQRSNPLRSPSDVALDSSLAAANDAKRADYKTRQTTFYAALAVPITLGAATAGLAAWYWLGAKERDVPVVVAPMKDGAAATVQGRF